METTQFSDSDISAFLADVIELGGINTVDNSPDKIIRLKTDGSPEELTVDGENKPLAIYGTRSEDAIIINPFSEGESESIRNSWFYLNRNVVLSGILIRMMKALIKAGADSHKKSVKEQPSLTVIKLIEGDVDVIDDKMVKEFASISRKISGFVTIHYNKSTGKGELKSVVFNQVQRKAYPGIRKASWPVFENLMAALLGTHDLSDFDYKPKTIGIPVFESFVNILVAVYKRLIPSWELVADLTSPVDKIGELESHLKYLPQYYAKAKYSVGITPASRTPAPWAPTPTAVPSMQVDRSAPVPITPGAVPTMAVPGPSYISGTPVMAQPGMSYAPSYGPYQAPYQAPYQGAQMTAPVAPIGTQPVMSIPGGAMPQMQPNYYQQQVPSDSSQVNARNPFARP